MAEVISLSGDPLHSGGPVPDCVEALENALERARSGEVIGAAIITLHSDRAASYALGGYLDSYGVIGALDIAKSILVKNQICSE